MKKFFLIVIIVLISCFACSPTQNPVSVDTTIPNATPMILYDIHGNVLPTEGEVFITDENLECYLSIVVDCLSDGDPDEPMLVAYSYTCELNPDILIKSADITFDIVFSDDTTATVHFTGTSISSGKIPKQSYIPFYANSFQPYMENATGTIQF